MFGQNSGQTRERVRHLQDLVVGKTGEVAFQRFLKKYHKIDVDVDWQIYDNTTGDSQDILLHHHRFEVKSIKSGDWLMIEPHTLKRRRVEKNIPHYFVLIRVPFDKTLGRPKNEATIVGYCSLEQIALEKNFLKKGSTLPRKSVILESDNYGVHSSLLRSNWNVLLYQLRDVEISLVGMKESVMIR